MGLLDLIGHKYPFTDFHELNLDWCISAVLQLQKAFEDFSASNKITFAEPIYHDLNSSYAKNTIVIDASGTAYLSLQTVPKGVQLANTSYWLPVFDFAGYIMRANKNFTNNYFADTDRAPYALAVDDWLVLDDVLYKVTQAIAADDLFIIGTNIIHFTIEQLLKDFISSVNNTLYQYSLTIQQYKDDIDASEAAYRQQLAYDMQQTTASLQAQLDLAISGATVDSEVINARLGADGVVYATLGDAIRTQIGKLNSEVFEYSPETLIPDSVITKAYIDNSTAKITSTTASSYKVAYFEVEAGKYRVFGTNSANTSVAFSETLPDIGTTCDRLVYGSGTFDTVLNIEDDGYLCIDYKIGYGIFVQKLTELSTVDELSDMVKSQYIHTYVDIYTNVKYSNNYVDADGVIRSGSSFPFYALPVSKGTYHLKGTGTGAVLYPSCAFDKALPAADDRTIVLIATASSIDESITIYEDGYLLVHTSLNVKRDLNTPMSMGYSDSVLSGYTAISRAYINNGGVIRTASGSAYSVKYLAVTPGVFRLTGVKAGDFFTSAIFTSVTPDISVGGQIIYRNTQAADMGEPFTIDFEVTDNGYIAIDGQGLLHNVLYALDLEPIVDYVANETDKLAMASGTVDDIDHMIKLSENPIECIREQTGFAALFDDWGFIGDSLSSGAMNAYGTGGGDPIDLYPFSWGQQLCKLCGTEGYNFSYGGATAKHWLNSMNERAWGGAQNNPKKVYSIALGVNDGVQMATLYPNGVGDNESIDLSDYDNNDYDTFIGNIAGIIQRLKSIQPNCIIFVWTMPQGDTSTGNEYHEAMAEAVKDLPELFTNVHIIDLWDYAVEFRSGSSQIWAQRYKNQYHLTPAGYIYLTYLFANYVDWIMRKYPAQFKDLAFIGEEYSCTPIYVLDGTVTDGSSNPIADAYISLTGDDGQFYTNTDSNGEYRIATVHAGTYDLFVKATGYTSQTIPLTISADATEDITMS